MNITIFLGIVRKVLPVGIYRVAEAPSQLFQNQILE